MRDLENRVHDEGLDFLQVGESDHPKGSLPESLTALGRLKGVSALRFTIRAVAKTTEMMLRDLPAAVKKAQVSMLLVDQMEPAGGTVAEYLGLPFVTVCNALALNREPDIPPPFTPWSYRSAWWARMRNGMGYAFSDRLTRPITRIVEDYRKDWNLPPHRSPEDSFSPLAQISQQPPLFDFPRRQLPGNFHYAGPLRKKSPRSIPFPWDRLDGRPLIYASLGTLQNSRLNVFRCFAEACAGIDAQLVITHGGGLDSAEAATLPGNPVVVAYAPQLDLLSRARLTLTHAGLNTVIDSLTHGVPLIAIPITYEQPAIAERVRYTGTGEVISLSGLNPRRLREALLRLLAPHARCRENARRVGESIRQAGGVIRVADVITERALSSSER